MTLTGTCAPGATLEVTVEGVLRNTAVGDVGTWSIVYEAGALPEGEHSSTASVTSVDAAGNGTNVIGALVVDAVPPAIIVMDGGTVNGVEMDSGVEITGTGEAGATLEVTVQGVSRSTTIADDGTRSVTYQAGTSQTGEYTGDIDVTATDAAGNTDAAAGTLVVDTATDVTIDTSAVEGDGLINAAERADGVALTGFTQPGAFVEVTFGAAVSTVPADATGIWTADVAASAIPAARRTPLSVLWPRTRRATPQATRAPSRWTR